MIGSQMNGEPTSLGIRNPRVAGGSNGEVNLVAACRDCNLGKEKSAIGTI